MLYVGYVIYIYFFFFSYLRILSCIIDENDQTFSQFIALLSAPQQCPPLYCLIVGVSCQTIAAFTVVIAVFLSLVDVFGVIIECVCAGTVEFVLPLRGC